MRDFTTEEVESKLKELVADGFLSETTADDYIIVDITDKGTNRLSEHLSESIDAVMSEIGQTSDQFKKDLSEMVVAYFSESLENTGQLLIMVELDKNGFNESFYEIGDSMAKFLLNRNSSKTH